MKTSQKSSRALKAEAEAREIVGLCKRMRQTAIDHPDKFLKGLPRTLGFLAKMLEEEGSAEVGALFLRVYLPCLRLAGVTWTARTTTPRTLH